ncbi:unnamed protein product [Amoebophrya sp. A120]|nr:unnamed protein product [Amoebophrya sp. A120]|eukprot:GSA120T00021173001.1
MVIRGRSLPVISRRVCKIFISFFTTTASKVFLGSPMMFFLPQLCLEALMSADAVRMNWQQGSRGRQGTFHVEEVPEEQLYLYDRERRRSRSRSRQRATRISSDGNPNAMDVEVDHADQMMMNTDNYSEIPDTDLPGWDGEVPVMTSPTGGDGSDLEDQHAFRAMAADGLVAVYKFHFPLNDPYNYLFFPSNAQQLKAKLGEIPSQDKGVLRDLRDCLVTHHNYRLKLGTATKSVTLKNMSAVLARLQWWFEG